MTSDPDELLDQYEKGKIAWRHGPEHRMVVFDQRWRSKSMLQRKSMSAQHPQLLAAFSQRPFVTNRLLRTSHFRVVMTLRDNQNIVFDIFIDNVPRIFATFFGTANAQTFALAEGAVHQPLMLTNFVAIHGDNLIACAGR